MPTISDQIICTRGYVWDDNTLAWMAASQAGATAGGGDASAAKQDTGNASLASIDSKLTNPLPVSGAFYQATQPVSLASVPSHPVTNAGTFPVQVTSAPTTAVTGTFWQATQPVSGTFWQATQPVSAASLPLPSGASTESTLSTLSGKVTACNTGAVTVSSLTPPTLTKATQGATGFSVQQLRDAGRTAISLYATNVAAGTTGTETAISLIKSTVTGAAPAVGAASITVTSGKRFRITAMSVASRGHATATAQISTFTFRMNTTGATTTSSNAQTVVRSATPATALAWDRVYLDLLEGVEILGDGTLTFGVTANAVYTTNAPTWDVSIIGYEY